MYILLAIDDSLKIDYRLAQKHITLANNKILLNMINCIL